MGRQIYFKKFLAIRNIPGFARLDYFPFFFDCVSFFSIQSLVFNPAANTTLIFFLNFFYAFITFSLDPSV